MPSSAPATTQTCTLSLHDALPISGTGKTFTATERFCWLVEQGAAPDQILTVTFSERAAEELRVRITNELSSRRPDLGAQALDGAWRSEEHTSELQSRFDLVCRLLLPPPLRPALFPYTTLFRSRAPERRSPRPSDSAGWSNRAPHRTRSSRSHSASAPPRSCGFGSPTSFHRGGRTSAPRRWTEPGDRKSTRLNSSHVSISYAVFCSRHHSDLHSFPTRRSSDLGHRKDVHRDRAILLAGRTGRRTGPDPHGHIQRARRRGAAGSDHQRAFIAAAGPRRPGVGRSLEIGRAHV